MGHMLNGKWVDDDRITADVRGAFVRADSQFRNWVTADDTHAHRVNSLKS